MKLTRLACFSALFALTLAFAGCGDDDGKKDAENKKKVEGQLAKVPGYRNATVTVKGDTLTIVGFSAEIPYEGVGVNRLNVEEIKAEGVDFEANTKPGVVPVAKKITFKNYRTVMEMKDAGLGAGSSTGVVESMDVSGLQLDAAGLDKALSGEKVDLKALFAAAVTYKGDSMSFKNYRIDFNMGILSGTATMDKASAGAFSLMGAKDMSLENCKFTALGSEMFYVGKSTIKEIKIPDVFTPFIKHYSGTPNPDGSPAINEEAYQKDMLESLKKNPFVLSGMVLEDMKIRPMTNDALTLKKLTADFEFSQERIIVKSDMDSFVVPPSVYGKGMEGMMLARLYGKPFDFSGKVDFEAVKEGAGGRMAVNALNLTEKNLGGCDFTFKGTFAEGDKDVPAVPSGPNSLNLGGLSVTLKDTGMLDLLFGIQAEENKSYNPSATKESVRAETVQLLSAMGGAGGVQKQVSDAFVKFLNGSGSFSLSMAPSAPISMDALQGALNSAAENLNLKVSGE